MLFFVPSGAAWDEGYFDRLGDSHCIVPYRIVYPIGHDGTSIDGVTMFCWDCNHPFDPANDAARNCRLVFRMTDGEIRYDYFDGGGSTKFRSEDGVTLATMTNGKYLLSDTTCRSAARSGSPRSSSISSFRLLICWSRAHRGSGRVCWGRGSSQDPGQPPLLSGEGGVPASSDNEALTDASPAMRAAATRIDSIAPNGVSMSMENVATGVGQVDVLAANADGTTLRFTPVEQEFHTESRPRGRGPGACRHDFRHWRRTNDGDGPEPQSGPVGRPRQQHRREPHDRHVQVGQIVKDTGSNAKLTRNGVVPVLTIWS